MSVLAGLCVGAFCALLAGACLGTLPDLRVWRRRSRRRDRARVWLAQAGVGLSPARFWAGSIAAGLIALLVLTALTGSLFVALVPAFAVALLPRAYFARRRRLRMREVQAAWPDAPLHFRTRSAAGSARVASPREKRRHRPAHWDQPFRNASRCPKRQAAEYH